MDEPAKPKRKFWRFHLSTAVLLMFAASGIGWVNSTRRFTEYPPDDPSYVTDAGLLFGWVERGWPLPFQRIDVIFFGEQKQFARFSELYIDGQGMAMHRYKEAKPSILPMGAVVDGAVALALLFLIALVSEYLIRRREGRKP